MTLFPAMAMRPLTPEDVQGVKAGTHVVVVLPEQVSISGIERQDRFAVVPGVHDSVMHYRSELVNAGVAQAKGPRRRQVFHVVAIDLLERAVGLRVIRAPPHQPVIRRRVMQHLVRNRRDLIEDFTHLCGICSGDWIRGRGKASSRGKARPRSWNCSRTPCASRQRRLWVGAGSRRLRKSCGFECDPPDQAGPAHLHRPTDQQT